MWPLRPGVPDGLRPLTLLTDRSQGSPLAEPGSAFPPSQLRSAHRKGLRRRERGRRPHVLSRGFGCREVSLDGNILPGVGGREHARGKDESVRWALASGDPATKMHTRDKCSTGF